MNEHDAELSMLQADITRESQTLEEDVQAKQEQLRSRMDAIQQTIEDLQNQHDSKKSENDRLSRELTQAEAQLAGAKKDVVDARMNKRILEEKIASIKTHTRDPLSAFGRNLGDVDQAIQSTRWHGCVPVGPLGRFVELDDVAKWGNLMRTYIGRQMQAFAITDTRDWQPLKTILKRTGK
jgi:chromosome segregation ATPase